MVACQGSTAEVSSTQFMYLAIFSRCSGSPRCGPDECPRSPTHRRAGVARCCFKKRRNARTAGSAVQRPFLTEPQNAGLESWASANSFSAWSGIGLHATLLQQDTKGGWSPCNPKPRHDLPSSVEGSSYSLKPDSALLVLGMRSRRRHSRVSMKQMKLKFLRSFLSAAYLFALLTRPPGYACRLDECILAYCYIYSTSPVVIRPTTGPATG